VESHSCCARMRHPTVCRLGILGGSRMDEQRCWPGDGLRICCRQGYRFWGRGCGVGGRSAGGLIHRIGFLVGEELLVGGGGDGDAHEGHPDGQGGARTGFLFAEGLLVIVANPDSAGDGGREAEEPGIGEVAGGAGFAAERMMQLRGRGAGSMSRDRLEEGHHGAGGLLAQNLFHFGHLPRV